MIAILSPAKAFHSESSSKINLGTDPFFLKEAIKINKQMRKYSQKELIKLLKISPALAEQSWERFQRWKKDSIQEHTNQAILSFKGEAYRGLDAHSMCEEELKFAQDHLRILSGHYGVLRPLDLIQYYRLEMGTKLAFGEFKNLYAYWGDKIANHLNRELSGERSIINLASNEYFKSVNTKKLNAKIITPIFKDFKDDQYKTVMVYAKYARGAMVRFIIKNGITESEHLKAFDLDGYRFSNTDSTDELFVFLRG